MTRVSSSPRGCVTGRVETLLWLLSFEKRLRFHEDEYGETFQVHFVRDKPWIMCANREDVAAILAMKPEQYRPGTEVMRPTFGKLGTLTLSGDEHARHRKMIMPLFNGREHVEQMRMTVEDVAYEYTGRLKDTMRFGPMAEDATLEVIVRLMFGRDPEMVAAVNGVKSTYKGLTPIMKQAIFGGGSVFVTRPIRKHWSPLRDLIQQRIDDRRAADDIGTDLLAAMLTAHDEHGNGFSDAELSDEFVTLLISGHETTAKAMAWTLELLLQNDMLDRARDDHEFLGASIREALRVKTIVPDPSRRLRVPFTLPGTGYTIPAGYRLALNLHAIHRDPQRFLEPTTFSPERFIGHVFPKTDYLPFGGGGRRCLGANFAQMEAETMMGVFLSNRTFTKTRGPEKAVRDAITLAPKHGVEVDVAWRS